MILAHVYELSIEQLKRNRTVTVFLPKNYNPEKLYPLLIMHDGQNLASFCNGSVVKWDIDLYQKTNEQCIIVGINCDNTHRLNEYAPFPVEKRGQTLLKDYPLDVPLNFEGPLYIEWIVTNLIPFLQNRYPINHHIGIAGSSMGGIISLYALLQYPDTLSFGGVISPAYWFCKDQLSSFIKKKVTHHQTIYTTVGTSEGGIAYSNDYLDGFNDINNLLEQKQLVLYQYIIKDGIHNEAAWAQIVGDMLQTFLNTHKKN